MVMNGEIYNFADLKATLLSSGFPDKFRGHSDTEILLGCIETFGFEETLKKTIGMFAIALWDRKERTLTLARDRFGEKPVYYGWRGNLFLFGSELKTFYAHPQWQGEIDRGALTLMMRHGYIPEPYSIYQGIYKLPPGSSLVILQGQLHEPDNYNPHGSASVSDRTRQPQFYWDFACAAQDAAETPFSGSETEAIDALDMVLKNTVRREMVADTPVGAFLSGGIDSSLVVSLMQACAAEPVKSFTIGFNEKDYNEAAHAKAVAKHLGTDHTELYVTMDEARDVIPLLPSIYDEPFADSSQIPTYMVSKLARERVTVSLSGDGADEIFGGYDRFQNTHNLWNKIQRVHPMLRRTAAGAVNAMSPAAIDMLLAGPKALMPSKLGKATGNRAKVLSEIASSKSPDRLYEAMISSWKQPESVVKGGFEPRTYVNDSQSYPCFSSFYERMMFLDSVSYLPGDILVKVDRASMAVSLESRAPYLDHTVAEFAWSLPMQYKIRGASGKWILKQLLYRYVPQELVDRPKKGFGVPIRHWLRGPLKDWAENLISETRLERDGYFNAPIVRQAWADHLTGHSNKEHMLWPILMFQAWMDARP
jgi:asparagine synthase (glutamine-hydrolysing)